jgi:hypothetical protein
MHKEKQLHERRARRSAVPVPAPDPLQAGWLHSSGFPCPHTQAVGSMRPSAPLPATPRPETPEKPAPTPPDPRVPEATPHLPRRVPRMSSPAPQHPATCHSRRGPAATCKRTAGCTLRPSAGAWRPASTERRPRESPVPVTEPAASSSTREQSGDLHYKNLARCTAYGCPVPLPEDSCWNPTRKS